MKKSRFGESQMVAILEDSYSGVSVKDTWRKCNTNSATYYMY